MMKDKLEKVGVLYGGRSAEREVSIMSGKRVLQALRNVGINAHPFDPAERSLAELEAENFGCVFIALHGRYGEDGTMQGALEQLGIPYTGSGVMPCAIAMDKIMTKRIWQSIGLPTPRFLALDNFILPKLEQLPVILGLPLMLKAAHEGSTIGISKVIEASELQQGFDLCKRYDSLVLAEEFIHGRELTIPILGSGQTVRALPIVEIHAPDGNYDYQNKYFSDDTKYSCPAELDAGLTEELQALAVKAFNVIGCRGWARVDLMLDQSNKPHLLEINTAPGMTSHSLVPMAAKAAGMSYEELCSEIVKLASLDLPVSADWKPV